MDRLKAENIQAKAAAAAQLLIQDLDPEAKKRRQLFINGPPQGIVSLHAKSLANFSKTFFFTSQFAGCHDIRLYLKIEIQGIVKCTKIVSIQRDANPGKTNKLVMGKQKKLWNRRSSSHPPNPGHRDSIADDFAEIQLDEVKTFPLEIPKNKSDQGNFIVFELIEADDVNSGQRHKSSVVLGHAKLHIYDLIKEMQGWKAVQLMIKDKQIANLQFEFVFRYGVYGYGFSHQLKQNEMPIADILQESLFFNLQPPIDRSDDDGLLSPVRVKPPDIILDDAVKSDTIGEEYSDIYNEIDQKNANNIINSRHRLERMKKEYKQLQTRHDRIQYLEHIVAKSGTNVYDNFATGSESDENLPDDSNEPQSLLGSQADSKRQSESIKAVIGNLSPLLEMASGIQTRGSARRGVVKSNPDEDENVSAAERIQRIQMLYEKNQQEHSSEHDNSEQNETTSARSRSESRAGFMGVLKRKVLAPMRFNKLLGVKPPSFGTTANDDRSHQQSSESIQTDRPATPPNMSSLLAKLRAQKQEEQQKRKIAEMESKLEKDKINR